MSIKFLWIFIAAMSVASFAMANGNSSEILGSAPPYLYKVLSVENWNESQAQNRLVLSNDDNEFIHLATDGQLDRIVDKYWSRIPEYVILKLDTAKLQGRLAYEANPGGSTKYYHLYEGSIPLQAVLEVKMVRH